MLLIPEKVEIRFDWRIGEPVAEAAFLGEFFEDVIGVFPVGFDFFNY